MSLVSPFLRYRFVVITAVILLPLSLYFFTQGEDTIYTSTLVERGEVVSTIGVSGYIEAPQVAKLTFPTNGVVTAVFAKRGDLVQAGTVLATLGSATQIAERNQAVAQLEAAKANFELLNNGVRDEAVELAEANVAAAASSLEKILAENEVRVSSARRILNSSQLEALSTDGFENTTAPEITGTYTCEDEGTYDVSVYRSNSSTGYSYEYKGLEQGRSSVTTDHPSKLGGCGLFIQFSPDMQYGSSEWIINIPNKRSPTFINNSATLENTMIASESAASAARESLNTAQKQAGLSTAPALSEELRQAEAQVNQARARVLSIDSTLSDRSIVAPFDGVVADIDVVAGEVASLQPLITLLAEDAFELVVRIPEIDSTKVLLGQTARATFDAAPNSPLEGEVIYISPLATEIDGVAYFETRVELKDNPSWLRAGLNADVDIIVENKQSILRLPRRFVIETPEGYLITTKGKAGEISTSSVNIGTIGSNGYIEVTSLTEGTEVITP